MLKKILVSILSVSLFLNYASIIASAEELPAENSSEFAETDIPIEKNITESNEYEDGEDDNYECINSLSINEINECSSSLSANDVDEDSPTENEIAETSIIRSRNTLNLLGTSPTTSNSNCVTFTYKGKEYTTTLPSTFDNYVIAYCWGNSDYGGNNCFWLSGLNNTTAVKAVYGTKNVLGWNFEYIQYRDSSGATLSTEHRYYSSNASSWIHRDDGFDGLIRQVNADIIYSTIDIYNESGNIVYSADTINEEESGDNNNNEVSNNNIEIKSISDIGLGDYIEMGSYEGERIIWRCVGIKGSDALMVSDKVLCKKSFDVGHSSYNEYHRRDKGSNYWPTSCICQWLNSNEDSVSWKYGKPEYKDEPGFLTNFTDEELSYVKKVSQKTFLNSMDSSLKDGGTSKLDIHDGPFSNTIVGVTKNSEDKYFKYTNDSFFLLGPEQAELIYDTFGSDYLTGIPSENLKNKEGLTNDSTMSYFLRLAGNWDGSYENQLAINAHNTWADVGSWRCNNVIGIRPAFYLNINSEIDSTEDVHNVTLKYDSDFDKNVIDVSFDWGLNLLKDDARNFNLDLAFMGAVLSKSAYHEDLMKSNIQRLGFNLNNLKSTGGERFDSTLENLCQPLTYVAFKPIKIDGENYNFFIISIRGTSNTPDFLSDLVDGADSFKSTQNVIKQLVVNEMVLLTNKSVDTIREENNIFYICGHSYGGATANRLATVMTEYASADNIFAYTYESPHTCWTGFEKPKTDVVPHNLMNVKDFVTYLPLYPLASTYGNNYFFNSDNLSNKIFSEKIHKDGNVRLSPRLLLNGIGEYDIEDKFFDVNIAAFHTIDWDLLALYQQKDLKNAFSTSWLGVKTLELITCPVDIQVFYGDDVLAESNGDVAVNYDIDTVHLWTVGDKKVVLICPDKEYRIRYKGTDTGTMNCIVGSFLFENGTTSIVKKYSNIALKKEKLFLSRLDTDKNGEIKNNVSIFVIDNNDNIIKQINTKGEEIDVENTFEETFYTIHSLSGDGGTISPLGLYTINRGNPMNFAINPNSGYKIKDVLVDGKSFGAVSNYKFSNVTADHTIEAQFEKIDQDEKIIAYTLFPSAGEGGTISPSTPIEVYSGESRTFVINPDSGYQIKDVIVDGESVGIKEVISFDDINDNHTIETLFEKACIEENTDNPSKISDGSGSNEESTELQKTDSNRRALILSATVGDQTFHATFTMNSSIPYSPKKTALVKSLDFVSEIRDSSGQSSRITVKRIKASKPKNGNSKFKVRLKGSTKAERKAAKAFNKQLKKISVNVDKVNLTTASPKIQLSSDNTKVEKVTVDDTKLKKTDYDAGITDNTVIIKGKGNYTGEYKENIQ